MSAPLKDQVARSLAELTASSVYEIDQIDSLLDGINAAYQKRNAIVHNALARHPDTGVIYSYREQARGSLQVKLEPITVKQVIEDATLIYNAGIDLMKFMSIRRLTPRDRGRGRNINVDRGPKARTKRGESQNGD